MYMHIGPIVNVGLAAVLVSLSCSLLCTPFRSFVHVCFSFKSFARVFNPGKSSLRYTHFLYVACSPPRRGLVAWGGGLDVLWHYHKKKSPLT